MEKTLPAAPYRLRCLAFAIDMLAVILVQITLGSFTLFLYRTLCKKFGLPVSADAEEILSWVCGPLNFLAYFSVSAGLMGNTLGKYLLHLQTLDDRGQPIGFKLAFGRTCAYVVASAISGWNVIGFILPLFRKDKKALHDLVCGTRVVERVPIEALNEEQLELPFLATVHPIRTPTTQEDPAWARTGTGL